MEQLSEDLVILREMKDLVQSLHLSLGIDFSPLVQNDIGIEN